MAKSPKGAQKIFCQNDIHRPGRYVARVIAHSIRRTHDGEPQVVIRFKTTKGFITGYLNFWGNGIRLSVQALINLGFREKTLSTIADGKCLVNKYCQIIVRRRTYQGKEHAFVQRIKKLEDDFLHSRKNDNRSVKQIEKFDNILEQELMENGYVPKGTLSEEFGIEEPPY